MTPDIFLKLAGVFLTNVAVDVAVFFGVTRDTFPAPLKSSGAFITLLTATSGYFLWVSRVGNGYVAGVVLLNLVSLALIYNVVKARDVGGINYGELTIEYLNKLDKQISYVMASIVGNADRDATTQAVKVALSFSIRALSHLLGLDVKHDCHFSILHAVNGGFEVAASDGIPEERIRAIEDKFRYAATPVSLAGFAAREGRILSLRDVSNTKDPNFNKWITTVDDEPRVGSIISVPLLRGLRGDGGQEPVGVLNLTSVRKGVFESVPKTTLIKRFAEKIEILLYCLEMLQRGA